MRSVSLLLLLLHICTSYCQAGSILIIESYHQEYPWDVNFNQGIRTIVKDKLEFHHAYMNTKRLPTVEFIQQADLAWQQYLTLKPDLVVLADDNAIRLLSSRFAKTEIPIVFLGLNSNPRDYDLHTFTNFTGVLERPLFKRSILLVNQTLANRKDKKVLVLFDNSRTSKAAVESLIQPEQEQLRLGNTQVNLELSLSYTAWQRTVLAAKEKGYDAIYIGLYHTLVDKHGSNTSPSEVMTWTNRNSPVPHFGFWEFSIGSKSNIGGYVLDGFEHGKLAGELILQILAGKEPSDLPYISDKQGQYLFSTAGVEKWSIVIPKEIKAKSIWKD
ncbi:hypothetical protein FM038_023880 [Shewanella eurypsychrophilus]|uniref:Sugar ABC transporter ATPase n=1 Tax=Shewanella eurypsychrophilus TaxID=2593656 RepID=A0ABX6VC04_9GAMM|nr:MULTISPECIES: ABC transporter substrate binding protein [Shewanella]QFU24867.1 hypothetical protein FS418_25530 [Shewanella sp. YLB-09]QPG60054.1 hypothetical protein FM038_023880 [Shewanella eurypsychrophilus]